MLLVAALAGCRQIRQAQRDIYKPVVTAPDGPFVPDSNTRVAEEHPQIKDVDLFRAIDPWMGVPYKFGGMTKAGVDCSGLVVNVVHDARGITLRRSSVEMMEDVDIIDKSELRPGDLVFFKIGGRQGYHVGIYTGNGRFVHASTTKGVIMSGLDEPYYLRHYYAAGRIK